MKTNFTLWLILILIFCSVGIKAQTETTLFNFETGFTQAGTYAMPLGGYGVPYILSYAPGTNPDVAGINNTATSLNLVELGGVPWWANVSAFTLTTATTITANNRYLHIMYRTTNIAFGGATINLNFDNVLADSLTGRTRFNINLSANNVWQDIVIDLNYLITNNIQLSKFAMSHDWNNSGGTYNVDEILLSNSSLPRMTAFLPGNTLYDFEPETSANITNILTYADANNPVTYPVVNPYQTGINSSAHSGKRTAPAATASWWTGFAFSFSNPVQIDVNHKYLHIMMTAPVSGQQVSFDVKQGATSFISDGLGTITSANTWQDVVLNVSGMTYISQLSIKCGNWTTTAAGDYYFDEIYIDASPVPRAKLLKLLVSSFNSTSVVNANDVTYTFTDNSTATGTTISSWNWTFPGGIPSSFVGQTPPTIKYVTVGKYPVTLTVSDGKGLTNTTSTTAMVCGKDPVLWYNKPSATWFEALPVGNGDLGAMVFGSVNTETLQLNEKSIWSGYANDRDIPGGAAGIKTIRNNLFAGNITTAESQMYQYVLGPDFSWDGKYAYQTMGELKIGFEGHGTYDNYYRDLDLTTSLATINYTSNNINYKREVIASTSENVIAVKYSSSKAGGITANFNLSRLGNFYTTVADASSKTISMTEHVGINANPTIGGVNMECVVKVLNTGGTLTKVGNDLRVQDADEIIVYITGASDLHSKDQHERNMTAISGASGKTYDAIKTAAISDYKQYYDRASLDLGYSNFYTKPTNERLAAVKAGATDNQLVHTLYQLGRYLMISSSRTTNKLPNNLQGIWAQELKTAWNSDYHMDVNLPMNYMCVEAANLSESMIPYVNFIDSLRRRGSITAKKVYGCNGAFSGIVSDPFYLTSPIGANYYGAWIGSGGWNCANIWDHYLFTKDKDFLQKQGYPVMKDYATFYADYLCANPAKPGELLAGPDGSPENSYKVIADGTTHNITMGNAGDHEIIENLFKSCIEASKILNIDADFRQRLQSKLDSLKRPMISAVDGRLCEWFQDYNVWAETELGHRHTQHLWGVYPGTVITQSGTPDLFAAAKKSFDFRVSHGALGTEWTNAYGINYYARFKDATKAYDLVYAMLKTNLWNTLIGNYGNYLIQLEGNWGVTAGITEMLIQSQEKNVEVLPALPTNWSTGSYKGLCARGGFVVDINWKDGDLTNANVYSKAGDTLTFVFKTQKVKIPTQPGKTYQLTYSGGVLKVSQSIAFDPLANAAFGDADIQLRATASSGLGVNYSSSDASVATIVAGKIHLLKSGTVFITATQSGNANYSAAIDVNQKLTVSLPAGINEVLNNLVKIYPNPIGDMLSFTNTDNSKQIEIISVSGQKYMSKVVDKKEAIISVDVSQLKAGVYFLQLKGENGETRSLKFVKD